MSSCDNCSSKSSCNGTCTEGNSISLKILPKYGKISNIIGVVSGKGGVGKSTITGMLAINLQKKGYKVGVLDADITGPSMPRFFGINEKRGEIKPLNENEVKFIPVETESGIKVISMNLLTKEEDQPLIWRGPVINGVLNQMYTDTEWGDLDYLLIDMPPGTGDIALTVMQNFPLKEIIVVRGVVENMSYIVCENCDKKMRVFSKKSAEEEAKYLGVPLIAELPIDVDFTEALNKGEAEEYVANNKLYTLMFEGLY